MNFSSQALPRLETVVAGLIILTVSLLLWQHFGMERVLEFSAASGRPVKVFDDRVQQGGSVAALARRRDALVMDCEIRTTVQWPYCQLIFPLSQGAAGIDLSAFDSISIDLSYSGPNKRPVRMTLRNFEPGLSRVDNYLSQKIIEIQFDAPAQGAMIIPVNVLRTAPWWVEQQNVPMARTDARIDNVTSIDLAHYRSQLSSSAARLAMLGQINAALELEASELAGQVCTDSLTGALNREGLRDALMKKWQQPQPANPGLAVLFVDLDHFKRINDTHGHAAGDDVLRAFSAAVRSEIRASDKLVRWGGEEFLIVCPSTGAAEAQALANKLREAIHHHAWPCGLNLTASFGVTALQPGEDIGEAIKRADGALYQAKADGRDCVRVA